MKILSAFLFNVFNSIFGNIKLRFEGRLDKKLYSQISTSLLEDYRIFKVRLSDSMASFKWNYGLSVALLLLILAYNSTYAQNITILSGQTITISTNTTYTSLTVNGGGTLIILAP